MNKPTMKEINDEMVKCKNSPYYFATKYIKILDVSTGNYVDYTTNMNENMYNDFFNNINNLHVKIHS